MECIAIKAVMDYGYVLLIVAEAHQSARTRDFIAS